VALPTPGSSPGRKSAIHCSEALGFGGLGGGNSGITAGRLTFGTLFHFE
jgi:hypothetical protein